VRRIVAAIVATPPALVIAVVQVITVAGGVAGRERSSVVRCLRLLLRTNKSLEKTHSQARSSFHAQLRSRWIEVGEREKQKKATQPAVRSVRVPSA
jgi:hypothetical protein